MHNTIKEITEMKMELESSNRKIRAENNELRSKFYF